MVAAVKRFHREGLDQAAGRQVRLDQPARAQGNAVAGRCGFDHHHGVVETDAAGGLLPVDAGRFQPGAPGEERVVQQGGADEMPGLVEAADAGRVSGTAHRHQHLVRHLEACQARPLAVAVAHADVDLTRADGSELGRCGQNQVDRRVLALEVGKAADQPLAADRRRDADAQFVPRAVRDGARRPFDVGERGTDAAQVGLARRRQDDVAVEAQEEADTQIVLELLDAMTDRRLGDTEFVGRLDEGLLPRRRLECLEGVHRRQTEGHRSQRRPSTTSATKRLPM